MSLVDNYYLQSQIDEIKRKRCCCGDVGLTTLSPPVDAPTTNGPNMLFNQTTKEIWIWDGDSWEVIISSNTAQVFTDEVELDSADIIGMFATPFVVVAGQPGKVMSLIKVTSLFTYGGVAYTGGGAVTVRDQTSGISLAGNILNGADVTGTANVYKTSPASIGAITLTSGSGITVANATAPFAAGNGSLRVIVTYQIFDL